MCHDAGIWPADAFANRAAPGSLEGFTWCAQHYVRRMAGAKSFPVVQTNGVVWAFADSEAEAVPEPTGEDFKRAVSVLLPYLLSHRTRLASLEDSSDAAEPTTKAAQAGGHLLKA